MSSFLQSDFLNLHSSGSSVVEILSILATGFSLGLRHALDADHLVAVSTIMNERKGFLSGSLVGALWGVGHTAALFVIGAIIILFNVHMPPMLSATVELLAALVLVALGVNVLWKVRRGAVLHAHSHRHGEFLHAHPHLHEHAGAHKHEAASSHHRLTGMSKKPLLLGMLHGMAGSAGLMLVVLATISSRLLAVVYILLFGIGSMCGMFLMSMMIGMPLSMSARNQRLNRYTRVSLGIVSICLGSFLAWQSIVVNRGMM